MTITYIAIIGLDADRKHRAAKFKAKDLEAVQKAADAMKLEYLPPHQQGRHTYASGCLIGNMALEVTPSSADVRAKLVTVYREWAEELADCLREAQASKELSSGKDTKQLAVALIDTFEGTVMRAKVERSGKPFESFERYVLPCLLA